jgi:type III pantothenate kinase
MLLLDAGNSRVKWARVEGDSWLQTGSVGITEWYALREAFAALPPQHKILASNVAGEKVAQQILDACAPWHCEVEFITAKAEQCGVRNTYEHPEQLGSDRWATLIAAWHHEHAACLVVTCGTATTIDALSGTGEFLGGLILPGIDMMLRSLAAGTAQLSTDDNSNAKGRFREFPRSTVDAILSGAIQATVGAIQRQYELLCETGARCLLSGGAAEIVQPHIGSPLLRLDNLVLQGLQILAQKS